MDVKKYDECIAVESDKRNLKSVPEASVVIVTYYSGEAVLELIDSLFRQSFTSFETIIINNGKTNQEIVDRIMVQPFLYIESRCNSVSLGRNIGVAYARGEFVIFLDDDCLAHKDLVEVHVRCYRDPLVLGARGKALPKSNPLFHHFQSHYDLGPVIKPTVIGLEGNSSFRKSVLSDVGGFNPELFGAEGLELSYRIVQKFKQPEALIYNPEAVIFHDFATGFFDYIEKCYRHPKMRNKLFREYPHIQEFAKGYGPYDTPEKTYSSLIEKFAVKSVGFMGTLAEHLGRNSSR